jgi:hypothetical protein
MNMYTIRFQRSSVSFENTAGSKETAVAHAKMMKLCFSDIVGEVFCANGRRVFSTEAK